MLITEGLAELSTLAKRIAKKQEFVEGYLTRQEGLKDPLEKDGGSSVVIERELQAINDLNGRIVQIRVAIQQTNLSTSLTVEGVTKSIAEWLAWRKEVSDREVRFVGTIRAKVNAARNAAVRQGVAVIPVGGQAEKPTDLIVNVSETALAKRAEQLEVILGVLDGQLSLKNATIQIVGL